LRGHRRPGRHRVRRLPRQLLARRHGESPHVIVRQPELLGDCTDDRLVIPFGDGADAELRASRCADLADDVDVERRLQRGRHRRGDRDATARHSEHDRVGQVEIDDTVGELPTCVEPVAKTHRHQCRPWACGNDLVVTKEL
jgi:hypothetical protein